MSGPLSRALRPSLCGNLTDQPDVPRSPGVIRQGALHADDIIDPFDIENMHSCPIPKKRLVNGNRLQLNFQDLPQYILLRIMGYLQYRDLTSLMLVSRQLNRLSCDPSLWRWGFQGHSLTMSYCQLITILSRGVPSILLENCRLVLGCGLEHPPVILSPLNNITQLFLESCNLTHKDAAANIISHCPRLGVVVISNTEINSLVMRCIGDLGMSLVSLSLVCCQGISYDAIRFVILRCRNLRRLYLTWSGLDCQLLSKLFTLLPATLRVVNIGGHRGLRARAVESVVGSCPLLTHLMLMDCCEVESVTSLAALHRLRYLDLSRCYHINRTAIGVLCDGLPCLTTLNAFHYDVDELADHLPSRVASINRHVITPAITTWQHD